MKTFYGKAELTFKLTQQDIDDIMVSALESGVTYWCCKAEVVGDYLGEYASDQISRGGTLKLHDAEEDAVYELDVDKFLDGFKTWLEKGYDEYEALQQDGTVDCCEIDACCADAIVQCALFGDVIYG